VTAIGRVVYQDGLFWQLVKGPLHGWVADKLPDGQQVLVPLDMPFLMAPVQTSRMTQGFGGNCNWYCKFTVQGTPLRGHNGVDWGVVLNTPIVATDAGRVMWNGFDPGGYGHFIRLWHRWGESIYAHLNEKLVSNGAEISRGQRIALSGNTGNSTGPHLHFAVRINPFRKDDGWGGYSDPVGHFG
jgi:murein DD-endopeptidase MepM/ murein hydrolase activator NlpD